ncbi:hypothetical protein KOI35_19765 [Actinoplanes bogorensis]|uniref:Uncharacterized protein n=1 Tax=Paractinoplanes bogorensis TaxID=1610840 RepID=A0ABS5YRM8_9ACTN|nr:hypothetical protein [Actinoplanes bogorensis]MBU2665751.1 hypothetical protein [Actinoplanes bogorensis]
MRAFHALQRALRTRRHRRINRDQADRIAATHPPGTDHPGLAALLEAARAPATREELAGEQEMVAAFVAHRKNAARSARRHRTARIRAALVPATAGLALLILAGTAAAARTGNLPQEAQQHAHRLFSALGVPAPRTGTPAPPGPSRPGPRPSTSPTLDVTVLGWCDAWNATPGRTLSAGDRRKLSDAAGGEEDIEKYCRDLHRSASAAPSPTATQEPSTTPVAPSTSPTVSPRPSSGSPSAPPTGAAPATPTPTATQGSYP